MNERHGGPTRVDRLLDRVAIEECITNLARGMDRHDAELMRASYHPDAIDDHGTFVGPAADFIDLVNGIDGAGGIHAEQFSGHQHYLMNQHVEIDDDEAHAETYFVFVGVRRESGGLSMSGGRYLDRLARREGRWGIVVRRVTLEWATTVAEDDGPRADLLARFTPARSDRADASYLRPLEPRRAEERRPSR